MVSRLSRVTIDGSPVVVDLLRGAAPPPPASTDPTPTRYVATTGSDSNPGTEAQPWRTVLASINKLVPGDVLALQPGTYTEEVVDGALPDGTASARVVLTSADLDTPALIDGSFRLGGLSYWTIRHLRFTNPTPVNFSTGAPISDPSADLVNSRTVAFTGGNDNIFEHNEVSDGLYAGLLIGRSSATSEVPHRWTVRYNYIHDTGANSIYFNVSRYSTGNLIERNILAHAATECLKVGWGGTDLGPGTTNYDAFGAGETTVRYNTMHDGGTGGIFIAAEPGGLYDVRAYRNIFDDPVSVRGFVVRYDSVEGYLGDKVYVTDNWGYGGTQFSNDFGASPANVAHESGNIYGTDPQLDVDDTWLPATTAAQAYGRYA